MKKNYQPPQVKACKILHTSKLLGSSLDSVDIGSGGGNNPDAKWYEFVEESDDIEE